MIQLEGKKVTVHKWIDTGGISKETGRYETNYEKRPLYDARFIAFGVSSYTDNMAGLTDSAAIVIDSNGFLSNVPVDLIQFEEFIDDEK